MYITVPTISQLNSFHSYYRCLRTIWKFQYDPLYGEMCHAEAETYMSHVFFSANINYIVRSRC